MKRITIYALLLTLLFSSCGDFLDEYSTDQRYCENADDLEALMIGEGFLGFRKDGYYNQGTLSKSTLESEANQSMYFPWIHVVDDDAEAFLVNYVTEDTGTPYYMLGKLANWSEDPFSSIQNIQWLDKDWTKLYKHIGALNSIIYQAQEIKGKDSRNEKIELLKHVSGEAHFLRAFYYFYLANAYGLPYSTASASTDFSVPLKVSEVIEDKHFTRATCEEVYQRIWADLEAAESELEGYSPTTNPKLRVGIGAVKAFKSRVALYMERYQDAIDATNAFSELDYKLIDLRQHDSSNSFNNRNSSELIFTTGTYNACYIFINDSTSQWNGDDNRASSFKASNDLMEKYTANDLRLTTFFMKSAKSKAPLPNKYFVQPGDYNYTDIASDIFSIRYAEVLLNKAEALAMLNKNEEARNTLQLLREKRIVGANISDIPTDNQQLIEFIRTERRMELCFEGHRWFDLRRYSVNSKYPLSEDFCITHPAYTYDAVSNMNYHTGDYRLESYTKDKAAWVIPIPNATITFNEGTLTNLVREKRNIINKQ
ncbi:MAG: RagB/SusD family nutrient uptake outer membrane protein [Prevotella sp.]|nr:RagB/SusD family nutrient uptake outer membrane protein [Prevotella sp.]